MTEKLKNFKYFFIVNDLCKTLTNENFDCIVSKNTQIFKEKPIHCLRSQTSDLFSSVRECQLGRKISFSQEDEIVAELKDQVGHHFQARDSFFLVASFPGLI